MTDGLQPYPEYKDSGIVWLGEVPSHWDLAPNRAIFNIKKETVGSKSSEYDLLSLTLRGVILRDLENMQGKFPASFDSYQIVDPDDFVFCLFDVDETPRTVGLSNHHGMITGAYTVMETTQLVNPRYMYHYYLSLDEYKALKPLYRGLRKTIPKNSFMSAKSPVPPPDEQDAIVHFLDVAERRIRRYIRAKQKLIKLLNEQKQAIINKAVTQGISDEISRLEPNQAPVTKVTNIPWLFAMPSHWGIMPAKQMFSVRKEKARNGDQQLSATQAYGVISQEEYERRIGRRVVKIFKHLDKRSHVEKDDFVISMRSFQGGLERAWETGAIRSSYVVLEPSELVDVDFFRYLFKSQAYIEALRATANFIRDGQDLNMSNFGQVDLPVIPLKEQKDIVKHIEAMTLSIDETIDYTKKEMTLVEEYRTRLIADVVTGKVDVRGVAFEMPEQFDDDDLDDDFEDEDFFEDEMELEELNDAE